MGKPNIATLEHRNVFILFFMGAVLVLITISPGRTQTVFADTATPCDVGVAGEGRFAAGEMSRRLEHAWNASDRQTLALFADDAHVLTAWGQFWEGKSQLSSFLHSFFYEDVDVALRRPLQTLAQCEDGDRVIWTFRYPSGVNSAMIITVQNAQVVNLYWQFLPYDFNAPSESLWVSGSEEARVSAAVEASAIALAGAGLMYLVVLSDGRKRPSRVSGKLLSALRARVETNLPDVSWDQPHPARRPALPQPLEDICRHVPSIRLPDAHVAGVEEEPPGQHRRDPSPVRDLADLSPDHGHAPPVAAVRVGGRARTPGGVGPAGRRHSGVDTEQGQTDGVAERSATSSR